MTELQMGLIGLGVATVAGVLAYNKWQETRQRRQGEEILKVGHPDVLFGRGREASDLASRASIPPAAETPGPARIEPMLRADPEDRDAPAPEEDARFFTPGVDFIVSLDLAEPVLAQYIERFTRDALARIKKPLRWIGFDEAGKEWRPISGQSGEYRRFRAGLQLVDRQGAISSDELALFSTVMSEMAIQLPGRLDLPPWQEALALAMDLDRFCASVDIQIGINLIAQEQAFAGTQLRALAESAGMSLDSSGHFVRHDEEGRALFTLLSQDGQSFAAETLRAMHTEALTFLLDVPCVANGESVFDQMIDLAQHFANVLRGALVDDNRRPLSAASLEPIRQQIGQYQALMATRQLPAGGSLTRRLFA